jgi:hypothetical protein
MTNRHLIALAGTVTAVVVIAVATAPFLPHRTTNHRALQVTAPTDPPSESGTVTAIATVAAQEALTCSAIASTDFAADQPPPGWCGVFTVTRHDTHCASTMSCLVELIGALTSPDVTTSVALTVTVQRDTDTDTDTGWRAVAVTS